MPTELFDVQPGSIEVHGLSLNEPPNPKCCSDLRGPLCPKCTRLALSLTGNSKGNAAEKFDLFKALDEWDDDDDRWDLILNELESADDDAEGEQEEEYEDDDESLDLEDDEEAEEEEDDEDLDDLLAEAEELAGQLRAERNSERKEVTANHHLPPIVEFDYRAWAAEPVESLAVNRRGAVDDGGWFDQPSWPQPTRHSSVLRNHDLALNCEVPQEHLTAPDADDYAAAFARR